MTIEQANRLQLHVLELEAKVRSLEARLRLYEATEK